MKAHLRSFAVALGALALAALVGVEAQAATCTGTPAMEQRLHAHADAFAYTQLGAWFGDHRQFECAADAFRQASQLEPKSARILYLYGLSLFTAGHPADAVTPLQQAAEIDPGLVQTHLLLGAAIAGLGHPREAEAQWEAALKIDPNSTIAIDGLAKSLIAQGDSASVVAHLRSAHLDENLTLDLIQAYGQQNMLEDALALARDGLKKYPQSDALRDAAVTVYVQNGQYEEAEREAQVGAQLHPHDLRAQTTYLRTMVLWGDRVGAPPLAKKLLTIAPHNADILYLAGVLDRSNGDFPAARARLEEALSLNPNIANARFNLGMTLIQLEDFKGAKEQLEKALAQGVTAPEVRFELGMALRKMGETEAAKEQFKLYQDEFQAQQKLGLALHDASFAAQALAAGDPNKAAGLYRQAVKATPDNVQLNYKLAMVLDTLGNTDEERTVLQHAIALDPKFALAQYQLGYLASRGGDMAAAEQSFRQAVLAAPGYSEAWISLAATLGMEHRFPEAQEAVANALRLNPKDASALQLSKDLDKAKSHD